MRGLKDRTVLVTGGANGIGAAIARRLAEEGCAVGILDMDAAAGEKLAGEIKAAGGRASLHAVDITDYGAVARAVEAFEAAVGPVAFLVNNAGWDRAANFVDTTPEFWRQVVAINLFGPLNMTHVVLRGMAARGFGRVVNMRPTPDGSDRRARRSTRPARVASSPSPRRWRANWSARA